MSSMSAYDILKELKEDKIHGASYYFIRSIDLISQAMSELGLDGVRLIIDELKNVRPGMASLLTLTHIIEQALARGLDLNDIINRLKREYYESQNRLSVQLDGHAIRCGSNAITISYSQAVTTALTKWGKCFENLFIMESRPGEEVTEAIKRYSEFVSSIKPIPDAAIAHFIEKYGINYVLVGADGLYSDGYFLNKIGTKTLMIVAREYDAEIVLIAESYKAAAEDTNYIHVMRIDIGGITIELPLFDIIPLDLVDYLITDVGIFRKPRPKDIESMRNLFINKVLNVGDQE